MMSDTELADFRTRCLQAADRNYQIANAEMYGSDLMDEVGDVELPSDMEEGSASLLAFLASAAMEARAAMSPRKKKSKKGVEATTLEAKVEEPKVEETKVETPMVEEVVQVDAVVEAAVTTTETTEATPEAAKVEEAPVKSGKSSKSAK